MRLAETSLIRAEAYGRKGIYASAVNDINVLRQCAAYKPGENRPNVLGEWEPQSVTLSPAEKTSPYAVSTNSYNNSRDRQLFYTRHTRSLSRRLFPTVTSKAVVFIHFIYNEKAREFLSEVLIC